MKYFSILDISHSCCPNTQSIYIERHQKDRFRQKLFFLIMKPLNRSYHVFVLLCICPPDQFANRWIKFRNITFSIMGLTLILLGNISGFIFIMKFAKIDLIQTMFAVLQTAALTGAIYTLIMAYVLRTKIQSVFNIFQHFYDSSKLPKKKKKFKKVPIHRHKLLQIRTADRSCLGPMNVVTGLLTFS